MYDIDTTGFDELESMLKKFQIDQEKALDILEDVAEQFTGDVKRLPKPRSKIRTMGHTHLLDTITYRRKKTEIEVGWGKYYGPMVEKGTRKMKGTPHLKPTFINNQEKYFEDLSKKIFK